MPSYSAGPELLAEYGLTPGRRRGYVLAAPVVEHVLKLEQLGWTYERTSLTAGLAACSVRQMLRQNNELIMARRAVSLIQIPLKQFKWKQETHGELACYHSGCRCDLCRETNIRHMKEWRRSRNRRSRLVDAEPTRQALQEAIDLGLTTYMETWRAIGGSRRTLDLLLRGKYADLRQPTSQRIRRHLLKCRERSERIVPDLCLVCGWPIAEHRPYYVHIEPRRSLEAPKELIRQCSHGHLLANDNVRINKNGRPICRQCNIDYQREYRKKESSR